MRLRELVLEKFLYRPLRHLRYTLSDKFTGPHNIQVVRWRNATKETADYVDSAMSQVQSVNTIKRVHSYASTKAIQKGLILEFGVYRGATINHIASLFPGEQVFGFDSFEGLPESWLDGFPQNYFKVKSLPKVLSNVSLIKGWFKDTLPKFASNLSHSDVIKYIHIDCDLYSSTQTIFNFLGQYIAPGTIIVFDEYFNYPGWKNDEFKAFHEFISTSSYNYRYLTYNRLGQQVAITITD